MKTGQNIRYLRRNPPNLPVGQVSAWLAEHYGLGGTLLPLDGEKDQNLRLRVGGAEDYVVKICNALETSDIVEFQLGALIRIEDVAAGVPVPRVLRANDGNILTELTASDGNTYQGYVLSYLHGELLADSEPDVATYRRLGQAAARIDNALCGYFHPCADQDHPWSLHRCLRFASLTAHIIDSDVRALVDGVFADLQQQWTALCQLRHQVIHQDAHAHNVLIDASGTVAGVIDFSDMTWGSYATELAIACNSVPIDDPQWLPKIGEIVHGFDRELSLLEEEVDAIYCMMRARLALAISVAAARLALHPEEANDKEHWETPARQLQTLTDIGSTAVGNALRKACRFPTACPATPTDATTSAAEDELLAARHQLLGESCKHFYDRPLHFERAGGAFLFATDGHAYLDTYNNVPQVGHCHPHVVKAISRQAAALNTNTRYLYSSAIEYAERLTERLAPHLDTCLFVNSGSEANDIAWQMAKVVSGQGGGLLMEDAYHGITEPIRAFSPGHPSVKLPEHLKGLIVPDPYRGPYREDDADRVEKYAGDADRAIAELRNSGHGLAAFMIDSAFCSSGVPDVPDGYLRAVEKRVRAAGGLMICDEVQSGFGRMGQWWGHEHHGVRADIVTMGKPVGNGHPLGVVVTSKEVLNRFNEINSLFSTFGGNTVACAAGNAVLDVIDREDLIARGQRVGDYFRQQLRLLAKTQHMIGDVRGQGMLIGLEFVTDRETRTPATTAVARLLESMRAQRVLVGSEGRDSNIFKLRPCLVFEEAHVDQFITALDASLNAL